MKLPYRSLGKPRSNQIWLPPASLLRLEQLAPVTQLGDLEGPEALKWNHQQYFMVSSSENGDTSIAGWFIMENPMNNG